VEYDQVPAHLRLCDILAAPFNTRIDPLTRDVFARHDMWWSPLKVFEYMAVGRPVVSSDLGMIPEYLGLTGKRNNVESMENIDNDTMENTDNDTITGAGILYPEGDIKALADCIVTLLDDPGKAQRMGEVGRKRVLDNYSWEKQAELTVEIYKKVIDGKK